MNKIIVADFVVEELEARFEMEAIPSLPSSTLYCYCQDPEEDF